MSQLPIPIPSEILRECYQHGRKTYPEEACGVISGPVEEPTLLNRFHPIANILGVLHEEDPERYPRTPADGYVLDSKAYIKLDKELSARGEKIKVIFHSHVDVGAYFSEEDKKQATWGDEPLFPEMVYLVCGIKNGRPDGSILVRFNPETRSFEEFPIVEP